MRAVFTLLNYYLQCLIVGLAILLAAWPTAVEASTAETVSQPSTAISTTIFGENVVLSVGITVDRREAAPSIRARGQLEGQFAVKFEEWIVSFDEISRALNITVSYPSNGKVRLSSPRFVTEIDRDKLGVDTNLGTVIRIRDLQAIPGLKIAFNNAEYAIDITTPNNNAADGGNPVLPYDTVDPPTFAFNAIQQNATYTSSGPFNTTFGELKAVGSLFGASWYTRFVQPQLGNLNTWILAEAQGVQQTPDRDLIIGSQPTFWRTPIDTQGDFWGATTILRDGFNPSTVEADNFLPADRTQSDRLGRTVSGEATPGSLVRLVQGLSDRVVREVQVDTRGVFRFENVQTGTGGQIGNNFRLLIYPEGQVTANPIVRDVNFSTVVGQLPAGASAFVASVGANRLLRQNNIFGEITNPKGGISYRRGVSNDLTLGGGVVFDRSFRGLGELFWQPSGFPLQVAVSALTGEQTDVVTDAIYTPDTNLDISLNTDRFSTRSNLNWQFTPSLTALASYDSRDGASAGGQLNFSSSSTAYTFARATVNTDSKVRWGINQRLDNLFFLQNGSEVGTESEIAYRISPPENREAGHELAIGYQTSNVLANANRFFGAEYRYKSAEQTVDGLPLWQLSAGAGGTSGGNRGFFGSISTNALQGLQATARYQNIALGSNRPEFALEFQTILQFQGGIRGSSARLEDYRTRGGISIQPFFDRNNNGKRDRGEPAYLDPNLLLLNSQSIAAFRTEIQADRLNLSLPAGSYRLDLNPKNYPANWRAKTPAQRINVAPGGFTQLEIPLVISYVVTGKVADSNGKPIAGARVELRGDRTKTPRFATTNDRGIYYLDGLEQENYQIQINGSTPEPRQLFITPTTPPTVETNFQISPTSATPPLSPQTRWGKDAVSLTVDF